MLGPTGRVYAVDSDPAAVAALARLAKSGVGNVVPVEADFTRDFALPGLGKSPLDGMLFANSLHFVREADAVLARLAAWIRPGGRAVLVEYDRRPASRWVPYPIPVTRLPSLATAAGLSQPVVTATRPSDYSGEMYAAFAERLETFSAGPNGSTRPRPQKS